MLRAGPSSRGIRTTTGTVRSSVLPDDRGAMTRARKSPSETVYVPAPGAVVVPDAQQVGVPIVPSSSRTKVDPGRGDFRLERTWVVSTITAATTSAVMSPP